MHDDGQKVAFEEDSRVGRPTAIMDSLAAYLNRNDGPYFFEPNPISDAETFWDFIRKNEGEVTSVTFEFIAPNMFGQADDYDKEMAAMRDEERVRRAKLQLENPDGLALETPRVKHAVNYAARGTGSIKAKTKRHKKFNSKNRVKKSTIPQNKNGTPLVEVIKNAIFTIFRQ